MTKKRTKKTTRSLTPQNKRPAKGVSTDRLLGDIRELIEQSREQVARTVNSALVWLYWNVGKRIREEILGGARADYGEQIVQTLSGQLTAEYGNGFSRSNLSRMVKLAEYFPDDKIVVTLSQQLSWSHFLAILPIDDPLKRDPA